jgi:hypothetical protein
MAQSTASTSLWTRQIHPEKEAHHCRGAENFPRRLNNNRERLTSGADLAGATAEAAEVIIVFGEIRSGRSRTMTAFDPAGRDRPASQPWGFPAFVGIA